MDDFYADLVAHPRVLRVVALSGGYSREEADEIARPAARRDRELLPGADRGPAAQQTDEEFNTTLDAAIAEIYAASVT